MPRRPGLPYPIGANRHWTDNGRTIAAHCMASHQWSIDVDGAHWTLTGTGGGEYHTASPGGREILRHDSLDTAFAHILS